MVGNTGPIYGTQVYHRWQPGETDERQVLDALKTSALWRVSVFGRVFVRVTYGTNFTRQLLLRAPVVMTAPGQLNLVAYPIDGAGASCEVTLTQATADKTNVARLLVSGPNAPLSPSAVQFVALTASQLTIAGIATAVPALSTVPLVPDSVLVSGDGFQEFEP